jgi:hypothetical protein
MNFLLWFSILFSPMFDVGVVLRIDQVLCPLLFAAYLIVYRRVHASNPGARAMLLYALASGAASLLCVASMHNMSWELAIRWPLIIVMNVMAACTILWTSKLDAQNCYRRNLVVLQFLLFVVGVIGLIQVAEHRRLIDSNYVTDVLSDYYPYWGELSDSALDKASGRQLKTGGAGRLTSVIDGHPLLAGDLLAFGLLLTMPLARGQRGWLLHVVPLLALVLTLSRGSILPWFMGVLIYSWLTMQFSAASNRARSQGMMRLISMVGLLGILLLTPLGDSILWRIETSIDTFHGHGVGEGRTSEVWPEVMSVLADSTKTELILGLGDAYDGPTDSQYLLSLVQTGVFGVAALVLLHVVLLVGAIREAKACLREGRSPEMAFAFIAAVCALLVMYVVHPSCQNRRLLTVLVAVSVLMFQVAPKYRKQFSRKDARRATPHHPPLHRALAR